MLTREWKPVVNDWALHDSMVAPTAALVEPLLQEVLTRRSTCQCKRGDAHAWMFMSLGISVLLSWCSCRGVVGKQHVVVDETVMAKASASRAALAWTTGTQMMPVRCSDRLAVAIRTRAVATPHLGSRPSHLKHHIWVRSEISSGTVSPQDMENATRQWLQKFVIGMNICPFAKASMPGLRVVVSAATTLDKLLDEVNVEIRHLAKQEPTTPATTLVVLPWWLHDIGFEDFMEGPVRRATIAACDITQEDVNIVPFHPKADGYMAWEEPSSEALPAPSLSSHAPPNPPPRVVETLNTQRNRGIHEANIPALISILREGSQEARTNASASLARLAAEDRNSYLIRKEGGIQLLIKVLQDSNQECQAEPIKALRALARDKQNQDVIREEGGIQLLVQLLHTGSLISQAEAAAALVLLTITKESRDAIRMGGGIKSLIKVFREGNQEGQIEAARALYNLAVDSQNSDAIRDEGGIQFFIQGLIEGREDIQANAANVLLNLASRRQNSHVIREGGGIPALIKVLRDGCLEAQVKAAGALRNLASTECDPKRANKNAIREGGGILTLIKVLGDRKVKKNDSVVLRQVQENAAALLHNLAMERSNVDMIRDEGGIQALINVLQKGNVETQAHAINAFGILAKNSKSRDMIREGGGIELLIKALRAGDWRIQANAAYTLKYMALSDQNRDMIHDAGGIQILTKILFDGPEEAASDAIDALRSLAMKGDSLKVKSFPGYQQTMYFASRSPYPMLHLLRESDLDNKRRSPGAGDIRARNADLLKTVGIDLLQRALDQWLPKT